MTELGKQQVEGPALDRLSGRDAPGVQEMQSLQDAQAAADPFGGDQQPMAWDFGVQGAGQGTPDPNTPMGAIQNYQNYLMPTVMSMFGNPNAPTTPYQMKMRAGEAGVQDWVAKQRMHGSLMQRMGAQNQFNPIAQGALQGMAGLLDPNQRAIRRHAALTGIATAGQSAGDAAQARHRLKSGQGYTAQEVAEDQRARALTNQQAMQKYDLTEMAQVGQLGQALSQEAGKHGSRVDQQNLNLANIGLGGWVGGPDLQLFTTPATAEERYTQMLGYPWRASGSSDTPAYLRAFGTEGPSAAFRGTARNTGDFRANPWWQGVQNEQAAVNNPFFG